MNRDVKVPPLQHDLFPPRDHLKPAPNELVDPAHFADGQRWAAHGLTVGKNKTLGTKWNCFIELAAHFSAGGNIADALCWLAFAYPALSRYDRRCIICYIVRWVRVLEVGRRVTQSLDTTDSPSKTLRRRILAHMPPRHWPQVSAFPNEPLTIQVDFGSALTPVEREAVERLTGLGIVQGLEADVMSWGQQSYKITFGPLGVRWLAEGLRELPDLTRLQSAMEGVGRAFVDSMLKRPSPLFPCDPGQPHFVTGKGTAFASMDHGHPPVEIGTVKAGEFTITKRLIALPQGDIDDQD